jgi:CBS domain-containing protein
MAHSTHQMTRREPMRARDIMTDDPCYALPGTSLTDVAACMVDFDCGSIPVVDDAENRRLVGIITDRDITCRSIAPGKNPLSMTVREVMSSPVITVHPDATLEQCNELMATHQVRRLPVVDANRRLRGMVTQAQLAKSEEEAKVGHVLWQISQRRQVSVR